MLTVGETAGNKKTKTVREKGMDVEEDGTSWKMRVVRDTLGDLPGGTAGGHRVLDEAARTPMNRSVTFPENLDSCLISYP